VKSTRDQAVAAKALDEVRLAAGSKANVMPALLDAARAHASVGEIVDALADVLGRW
jgi:methylmalonyl-CoA mutase N-terminal domain/subunit